MKQKKLKHSKQSKCTNQKIEIVFQVPSFQIFCFLVHIRLQH